MSRSNLSQVGPYQILREIGRGGMGVVWLAQDTRLDRPVAVKALPADLAADPDRLERFQREARILASLNHPNIASIHGLEQDGDARFLILEFVDGKTLAEIVDRGALPVPEALNISVQLASALQAAHEKGIVHRDIKPSNIVCRDDGTVKVLDFGLSRPADPATDLPASPASPTVVPVGRYSPTIPGAIMGTAGYMSPEQARGRPVDKRSDIFSFGCVLYEMLTGAPPFPGENVTDSLGATLHREPDWSRLPLDTPAIVQLLLRRCLAKDPSRRLHDIADARIEIEQAISGPGESSLLLAGRSLDERTPRRRTRRIGIASAGVLVTMGGLVAGWMLRTPREPLLHVAVPVPWAERIGLKTDTRPFAFDISPDGSMIAFVNFVDEGRGGRTRIYLRRLDEDLIQPVIGTDWAGNVSFSPDGTRLAFAAGDEENREFLRVVGIRGGAPLELLEDRTDSFILWNFAPRWISNTDLMISSEDGRTFYRVSTTNARAAPVPVLSLPPDGEWTGARQPIPLPDGRTVLFTCNVLSAPGAPPSLFRADLLSGEVTRLLEDGAHPRYSPTGHLLFTQRDTLCAAPFDLASLRVTGPIVHLVSGMYQREPFWPSDAYELSDTGNLAYMVRVAGRALVEIDRAGIVNPLPRVAGEFSGELALSSDGQRVLLIRADGGPRLVLLDLATAGAQTLVELPHAAGSPAWLPDGRIVYTHLSSDDLGELVAIDPAAPRSKTYLWKEPSGRGIQIAGSATPDGRYLVFEYLSFETTRSSGVYVLDLVAGGTPALVQETSGTCRPLFSPDGRWIAFLENSILMLRPFDPEAPMAGQARALSRERFRRHFWTPDGSELLCAGYQTGDLFSMRLTWNPELSVTGPLLLLSDDTLGTAAFLGNRIIDITPDGRRFVLIQQPRGVAPHIHLVRNWTEELRRRAPVSRR